jgi:uncharacterized protein (UPF0332 family)
MHENHVLNLHPYKTIRCLDGILDPVELDKIRDAVRQNVRQLLLLAQSHLRYAEKAEGKLSWRQRVSRSYYCCYTASRALRLGTEGQYSADVGDHKKIGELPHDFPSRAIWQDLLTKFRADRNLADYDHTVREKSLELRSTKYLERAKRFLNTSKTYLKNKGLLA